jgi:hypothetical protein
MNLMISMDENKIKEIKKLCERMQIRSLYYLIKEQMKRDSQKKVIWIFYFNL